jgi:dimethylaniline monooxygenase (N-oxide forming)
MAIFFSISSSEAVKHVTVLGAGKSSADMIYEAMKAGKEVSWIIRASGTGPGFFAPLDMKPPAYRNAPEAAQTRVMSTFQPSFLNQDTWWTRFLHSTSAGVWLVQKMFSLLDAEVKKRANYTGRKDTRGFEKLEYNPG